MPTNLRPAADCMASLIAGVNDDDLGRATPCTAYTVADLLDHIDGVTVAFGAAAAKAGGEPSNMGPRGDGSSLPPDWRSSIPRHVAELADAWKRPEAWSGITRVGGQDQPAEFVGLFTLGEL